jgi:predicted methyltransferase
MTDSDPFALPTSVEFAHDLVSKRVKNGDWVMDATAGNGHDTLFLARLVDPNGRVFAFDVQSEALNATRVRLSEASMLETCTLIHASHHLLASQLPAETQGHLSAIMFNLGWLPGHDKTCITCTETTLIAVQTALEWLQPGGLLTIVAYPGHQGGDTEAKAIADWASALPSRTHEVRHLRPANRAGKSPECWAIRPRPDR